MTLMVKVKTPIFNTSWEFKDANLVQIWLFQLKSITGYHLDKPNFARILRNKANLRDLKVATGL